MLEHSEVFPKNVCVFGKMPEVELPGIISSYPRYNVFDWDLSLYCNSSALG